MSCLECLEQTEGRVYDLEGEDCIILARVRRLLCVASMDDWSLLKVLENNAAVSQKCNWRRLSGLCDRPQLSVGVRAVRCGCYLVLNLIRIPCAVYIPFIAKGASFSLHGLTRPCEDLAPERGHVSDRKKDHVHDRSEQFLCNRLPLFFCCLLSVGAQLLHLPPSLGRSTTLRCRDLC